MNKYSAGIIGLGRTASTYDLWNKDYPNKIISHAGAYLNNDKIFLKCVADNNPEALNRFRQYWKIDNLYHNYQEMLGKEKIDILSVCTHPDQHFNIIKDAVASGVKAIFCEKPFTASYHEAVQAVSLCESEKVGLAIYYQRRYDSRHRKIVDYINSGKLGRVEKVIFTYSKGLINAASHGIDFTNFLLGKLRWIKAADYIHEQKSDASIDFVGEFQNGCILYANALPIEYIDSFEFDVMGTLGRIRIENYGEEVTLYSTTPDEHEPHFLGYTMVKNNFGREMKNMIVEAIDNLTNVLNDNDNVRSTGNNAIYVWQVIEAIKESKKTERMVFL